MTAFIIDCSVTMSWCFHEEMDEYATTVLDALAQSKAAAPALWMLEVANTLLVAERRERVSQADSNRFLGFLRGLPIEIRDHPSQQVWNVVVQLGRNYQLTAYDALYLFVANDEGIPIATKDTALRRAANETEIGVFDPD